MIFVHEGLPRSGKSYEAVVRRIIPALQSGRQCVTNIEGIDHDKVAEVTGLPVDDVRPLLRCLTDDELSKVPTLGLKNCLLVLDEVQNYWGTRARLGPEMVKWVAEHGHHGVDVILMTQDIKDLHVIWRRRVEIRQVTLKLTGVGKPNSYSVTTYRGKGSELYEKVGTKVVTYDPKYFGTYKSYSDSDVSTDVYKDSRASVWGSSLFRVVIPGALVAALWGAWTLWGYFHPVASPDAKKPAQAAPAGRPAASPATIPAPARTMALTAVQESMKKQLALAELAARPATELLAQLGSEYRIRLAGVVQRAGRPAAGVVEWYADGARVYHRMTFDDLRALGAVLTVGESHVVVRYGEAQYLATSWPVDDPAARVSTQRLEGVQQASGVMPPPGLARPALTASPAAFVPRAVAPPVPVAPTVVSASGAHDGELLAWMRSR
ncbi:MAG: hypothetical protein A2W72_16150 [Burkholderiales bacterium RIFCSPLOWO2_12_67_14]|nr:MAG: hypothetical protein A3I64_01750 [Burkholderiales bacterium RIFCSPLOWO2_02_FULL_67_64]OGB38635.1 MAG: hypothetical protein A2W72_16150 [Burkholderiales bacterium RIFCSPLOWO2_12_67_14]OGB40308.1 MAG: hypothetical protein A3E51_26775 [Burkholderiales bacterium RIFCSPHIGHO2_12_FULL_67_38]OGB78802.1 MAG: hypothetical protein A3G82_09645 [Burkholderiales bacterium RIFCSPLOWO2_12_FULL_67_210]